MTKAEHIEENCAIDLPMAFLGIGFVSSYLGAPFVLSIAIAGGAILLIAIALDLQRWGERIAFLKGAFEGARANMAQSETWGDQPTAKAHPGEVKAYYQEKPKPDPIPTISALEGSNQTVMTIRGRGITGSFVAAKTMLATDAVESASTMSEKLRERNRRKRQEGQSTKHEGKASRSTRSGKFIISRSSPYEDEDQSPQNETSKKGD
ncbi:hypothetical protein [Qipengyuania citrea]|uniref:hypothetical protein n=1 Tax=Qipengyuania citrea TaxID=225971 RepID=UPI00209DD0DC|nr:hypothetical protein [Qipengyuania citrea]MCP2016858.1 hypothetical protein [Qipengyuania citrea]